MAELRDRMDITVEDLEEKLGSQKLPEFIESSERLFVERTDAIAGDICGAQGKRAVFISGPTSSGKTTFTMRLADSLKRHGRQAAFLSLDDYYKIAEMRCDKDGRPDFETIDTLDIELAASDIEKIISGGSAVPPLFNFHTRKRENRPVSEAINLPDNGVLVVEGLHGLSEKVLSAVSANESVKIFIMPYGNVYCDTKLMDSNELRMLRRIVRDYRHRNAHALSTIDYWPMIEKSEEAYYNEYLARADYHINSFLAYESLIIAPLAFHDIKEALRMVEDGSISPSIFMEKSDTGKPFADLSGALKWSVRLVEHLRKIPVVDPDKVPSNSILNEFIGE